MKNALLALITTLSLVSQAHAGGDRIGNGGGLWGCYNNDGTFRTGQLMDLFEAKQQFGLYIPTSGLDTTPVEVLNTRVRWMRANLPSIHALLQPALVRVQNSLVMTDASLIQIDDAWPKIRPLPTECFNGEWKYTQFANYTSYDSILVNNYLWLHAGIPILDKAALILHEAVYLTLRERFGDQDSVRARHMNGLLFSNLPAAEIGKRIEKLLGSSLPKPPTTEPTPAPTPAKPKTLGYVCLTKNSATDRVFKATGPSEIDAEFAVQTACEKEGYTSSCRAESVKCEIFTTETPAAACIVKNSATDRTFKGRGVNKTEATAAGLITCQADGYISSCKVVKCADDPQN